MMWAKTARSDVDIMCIVANIEYETWFVAAAESLRDYLSLPVDGFLMILRSTGTGRDG